MRCSCTQCGTYMTHAESVYLGCVCPNCMNRCTACLGTNSVISKDDVACMQRVAQRIEAEPFDAFDNQDLPDDEDEPFPP